MSGHTQRAQTWITVLPANYTMPAFCFASVHQMAPLLSDVEGIWWGLATHLSTPKGWEAELAWLVDLQLMADSHKWLPIGNRSSAGQWSPPAKRPTFYRYSTQPTEHIYKPYVFSHLIAMSSVECNRCSHLQLGLWAGVDKMLHCLAFATRAHVSCCKDPLSNRVIDYNEYFRALILLNG